MSSCDKPRLISVEIWIKNVKNLWLHTPKDILNGNSMRNTNLYNLLG